MFSGIRWSATYVDKEVQVRANIVPGFKSGHSLVILSALLLRLFGIRGSVPFAFIIYLALDLVLFIGEYSLWFKSNASLTRS